MVSSVGGCGPPAGGRLCCLSPGSYTTFRLVRYRTCLVSYCRGTVRYRTHLYQIRLFNIVGDCVEIHFTYRWEIAAKNDLTLMGFIHDLPNSKIFIQCLKKLRGMLKIANSEMPKSVFGFSLPW